MMNHIQTEIIVIKMLKITTANTLVKMDRNMLIMVAKMMNFSLI